MPSSSSLLQSEVENWQLRLIYTALYSALGLVDLSQVGCLDLYSSKTLARAIRKAGAGSPSLDLDTASLAGSVDTPYDRYRPAAATLNKRFPSIQTLIATFRKHVGVDSSTALRKWRWLTRSNSDKLIRLYIRQNGESVKVMKRIAQTIAWQAQEGHAERELKRGESYYMDIEPDEEYIDNFKRGLAMLAGKDRLDRPLAVIRIQKHIMRGQKRESIHRAISYVYEQAFRAQNEQLEGCTAIFDFTGFSLYHHLDLPAMKFVVTLANMAFPCIYTNILVHNAPAYIEPFWKIVRGWLDPFLVDMVRFTYKTEELLQYVQAEQLPDFLGGYSRYQNVWTDPNEADDERMKDFRTKHQLLQERDRLVAEFEQLTADWVCGDEVDMAHRQQVADGIHANYWQLDPFVRSRNIFDRQGVLAQLRPELEPQCEEDACPSLDDSELLSELSEKSTARADRDRGAARRMRLHHQSNDGPFHVNGELIDPKVATAMADFRYQVVS